MKSLLLLDEEAAFLNKKDKVLYILIVSFFVTLYLPHIPVINNIIVAALALFSFYYTSFGEKRRLLYHRKGILIMVLLYVLHIISAFLSKNHTEGFLVLIQRLPLLVFPVTIGLIYIEPVVKERVLYAYAVITTLMALVCMVWGAIHYITTHNAGFLYNDSLTTIIDKQSVYMAMMVNLALFSFGYLLGIKSALVKKQGWYYIAIAVLLIANFLLASRIAITILYSTIICVTAWYWFGKKKLREGTAIILALFVTGYAFVTFFPKTLNRFRELTYTQFSYTHEGVESHYNMDVSGDQWNGANIRLAVWHCGWELAKQHPVWGVHTGDKMDRVMEVYAAKKFDFAFKSRRNLHNSYLDVLVSLGITGLLVFLSGFIVWPFVKSIMAKDVLGALVILAFAISLTFETYMDRSIGNMVFAFFISLVISWQKPGADAY